MERYDGDFKKYLADRKGKHFSESEILRFLANLFLAVYHINTRGIFHRDLKPANFLMKKEANGKMYFHLSDFGISKDIRDMQRIATSDNNIKGTDDYLAPEVL